MLERTFTDRIIAYKKGENYLAVSLEFDLLAEGNTIFQALKRLNDATKGYLIGSCEDNENNSEIYRKAPKKYQDMYELFLELSDKKRKKAEEKRKEKSFRAKETSTHQLTYNAKNLCNT